ncbi:hypothetical protein [Saccharothrix syringae]|uniref:Uncharacterized protein n=1 Tax=Saccharothrix syringae TaxID=103733 RepID=A0A5Q0GU18_SACSY|nr:hypothetical protein [Saccharothrix syringae]QFZ16872.1 hypothetical protein EKG83_04760 [Saccharothrix syringae]
MLSKVTAIAAATALSTVLLPAAPAVAQEGVFVGGAGISAVGTRFGFAVFGGGERAEGFAMFRNAEEGVKERLGGVTCLEVVGNAAIFKIKDTGSAGGVHRQFFVRDNGPSGDGKPTDELSAYGVPSNDAPDKCDKPDDKIKGEVLESGDVVIKGE